MLDVLEKLRAAQRKSGPPDYDTRIARLEKLEAVLLAKKEEVVRAVSADFGGRSRHETLTAEVMIVAHTIKHARTHLHEWMETEPRDVSWLFMPGRAEVVMQPLGVIGIIAPWNYPVQLALSPLVSVIAAGNRAMIKPSELVPETSAMLKTLLAEVFTEDEVVVVTGGVDVGIEFSKLPFDHLVFTGSTRVGKVVMRAAAENLVPVTLELGGKSPAIVGEDYSPRAAAKRIMFGKCFNAGQTCIAPDYVLVPRAKVAAFVEECRTAVNVMFPTVTENADYTSIVSDAHFARLDGYLHDARERGATIVELSSDKADASRRRLPPVIVLDVKDDAQVMEEEIFGPILPVRGYDKLDDAIAYVNDHGRPLALYYFDEDGRNVDRVLRETIAGGVAVNDTMLHIAQDDLPFGGVGPSGMGAYHAREGFDAFTKKKPVFYQSKLGGAPLFWPPYKRTIDFALRWLLGK